ncbi:virulence RhuM family protein [Thiolapillus sp.]|uniref:virulence RhuM family protein n=1 Tax=Thiolapillus sp. TaxID=2017437 RepID=UPI003AF7989C
MRDSDAGQVLIYQSESGQTRLEVRLVEETVWLTQAQMAELFQTSADNISLHLKNFFEYKELEDVTTTEDFSVVRLEGGRQVRRNLKHYNLDAIISVGYRVKSHTATRFHRWVTAKDYLVVRQEEEKYRTLKDYSKNDFINRPIPCSRRAFI